MSNLKEKLQQMLQRAADNAIREEMEEWPPKCSGPVFYQPRRPSLPQWETGEAAN